MPLPASARGLTGATRHRSGWLGLLVLQVEIEELAGLIHREWPSPIRTAVTERRWRDAKRSDLYALECLHRRGPPPPPEKN